MCKYCNTLAELRKKDLLAFDKIKAKYMKWYKEDDMLLRRCLIALSWKDNQELVDDILKQIGGDDEDA